MKPGPRRNEDLAWGPVVSSEANGENRVPQPANGSESAGTSVSSYQRLFPTFFAAGFECSTFKRRSGERLDLVESTRHDLFATEDYERLARIGMRVARDGVRWHLVENKPGHYDFSSVLPVVRAAQQTDTLVIWDLCHFGWPDDVDLFGLAFAERLARYGAAFAEWLQAHHGFPGFYVPVNEISFLSWASGDEGSMFPFVTGRGFELKRQLVRASVMTMNAIWAVQPKARFLHVDPLINVLADPRHPEDAAAAEAYRISQYQSWDMISGRLCPELGGSPAHLDIIGANYYPHNQWFYNLKENRRVRRFRPVTRRNPLYRPFADMLEEVFRRYQRPVLVAETGAEDGLRRSWFRYVCQQAEAAIARGVDLQGICLYPILNHPGWEDDRHCYDALWDYPEADGRREIYKPLAQELRYWQKRFGDYPGVRANEGGGTPQEGSRQQTNGGSAAQEKLLHTRISRKAGADLRAVN